MADDRAYRIIIGFDAEKSRFFARVPELEIDVSAASRGEVVTEAEHAIEQKIAASLAEKAPLAEPVDLTPASEAVQVKLGNELFRELAYHARVSGLSTEELAGQMLARAIGGLDGRR